MAFALTKKPGKQTYNVNFNIFLVTSNNCSNNKSRKYNRIHQGTSVNVKIMHMFLRVFFVFFFFIFYNCFNIKNLSDYVSQTIFKHKQMLHLDLTVRFNIYIFNIDRCYN